MGGRVRPLAVSSLRARARVLVSLGCASLVLLGVFELLVQDQVINAERDVVAIRQLEADNQALANDLAAQQAALRTYTSSLSTDTRPSRGLSQHDDLLNEYLAAAGSAGAALERLNRDSARTGVGVSSVASAVTAWQAWAAQRRSVAEAATGHPPPDSAAAEGEGSSLFAAFAATERILGEELRSREREVTAHADNLGADHARVFFAGLAVEAGTLLLLGVALLAQVVRPLGRLTEAAADLAAGRAAAVPYQDRDDEVGSLARALMLWQRSSTEMFRVFQRSPIGISRLDAGGHVLEANPAFERMVGVAPSDLDGRDLTALVAPADRREMLARLREVASGETDSLTLEARYLRDDATEFWADVTLASVPLDDGSRYLLAMVEDVDVRKRQEFELLHRAAHDPLTELPNRSLFEDRLGQALRAARRQHGNLAVVVTDLDRFKPVNDELGHHAGDEILRQVARRLRAALRESDTVARLGGDEFAIILPDQGAAGAQRTIAKLRRAMAAPFSVAGEERTIGMSAGAGVYPADARDGAGLVAAADRAMYAAKRRSINREAR